MKTLIIGAGEVGTALKEVLSPYHETFIRDVEDKPENDPGNGFEVLQICYPDHEGFVKTTKKYIQEYQPKLTIINSSVAVGTTTKIGMDVVYSPIRGRHPENGLAREMKVFTKFIGSYSFNKAQLASAYFRKCEWDVFVGMPESLEYLKLMSNVHMGLEIAWRQEVERMMEHFHINTVEYEHWERTYSEGYIKLGQYHLMRSRMDPGPIGGHCILPCTEILKKQFPSKAFDFILESNAKTQ